MSIEPTIESNRPTPEVRILDTIDFPDYQVGSLAGEFPLMSNSQKGPRLGGEIYRASTEIMQSGLNAIDFYLQEIAGSITTPEYLTYLEDSLKQHEISMQASDVAEKIGEMASRATTAGSAKILIKNVRNPEKSIPALSSSTASVASLKGVEITNSQLNLVHDPILQVMLERNVPGLNDANEAKLALEPFGIHTSQIRLAARLREDFEIIGQFTQIIFPYIKDERVNRGLPNEISRLSVNLGYQTNYAFDTQDTPFAIGRIRQNEKEYQARWLELRNRVITILPGSYGSANR